MSKNTAPMDSDIEVEGAPDLDGSPDIELASQTSAPVVKATKDDFEGAADAIEQEQFDQDDDEAIDPLDKILADAEKADQEAIQPRDKPSGKFAPKGGEQPADPFAGWDPEHRKVFDTLPEPARQMVTARETAVKTSTVNAANQHFAPVIDIANQAKPWLDTFGEPETAAYLERISSDLGQPPAKIVANILRFEQTLRYGTLAQKQAAVSNMVRDYGISLDPLSGEADLESMDPRDRALHDMRKEMSDLKFESQQRNKSAESALELQAANTITSFASQKDAQGNPKYPFLATVRGAMADLITSGDAKTPHEAYEKAVAPITATLKAQAAAEAKQLRDRNAEGVRRAQRTQPVRASMGPRAVREMSLDDIIASAQGG
jgi:hypothetical protein